MNQKILSAEIISKNKKSLLNQQPALFSEIQYVDVRQINYLCDLEQKKKTIDFPIFQFEKELEEDCSSNGIGSIANKMYRKIMQNGYIEEKKAPSKKKKKTKNPFQYDYQDEFINDDELMPAKKNLQFKLQNFKSLNYNIDQFYNSQQYQSNLIQLQQINKKKNNEIQMQPSTWQAIKKQIKQNLSIKRELLMSNQNNITNPIIIDEKHKQQNTEIQNYQKGQSQVANVQSNQLKVMEDLSGGIGQIVQEIEKIEPEIQLKQQNIINQDNIVQVKINNQLNSERIKPIPKTKIVKKQARSTKIPKSKQTIPIQSMQKQQKLMQKVDITEVDKQKIEQKVIQQVPENIQPQNTTSNLRQ